MVTTVEPKSRSGARVLVVLGVLVVGTLIVAAAVSINRSPSSAVPGTPEEVVQQYVEHVLAGRIAQAADLFDNPRGICATALAQTPTPRGTRVDLVTTSFSGDVAYVIVRVETEEDSPFGDGATEQRATFVLRHNTGQWKLVQATWPMHICGVGG
ncbi:MAG: hypothetical protein ACKV2O_16395 [Acidimicrobiales bacterium]